MHPCLEVPDIVREICQILGIDRSRQRNLSLYNLMLSCRALQHCAEEELWAVLHPPHGIHTVLDAMADDLWEFDGHVEEMGRIKYKGSNRRLTRELTVEDIHTLSKYTSRVRDLFVRVDESNRTLPGILNAIDAAAAAYSLPSPFPQSLQTFGLFVHGEPEPWDLSALRVFLVKRLKRLDLHMPILYSFDDPESESGHLNKKGLLDGLGERCPALQQVHFEYGSKEVVTPPWLVHIIRDLQPSLHALTIANPSREFLHSLSDQRGLEQLNIEFYGVWRSRLEDAPDAEMIDNLGGAFRTLKALEVLANDDTIDVAIPLLKLFRSSPLETLLIQTFRAAPPSVLETLLQTLADGHVQYNTLQDITILETTGASEGESIAPHPDPESFLEDPIGVFALSPFTNLNSLTIALGKIRHASRSFHRLVQRQHPQAKISISPLRIV